MKEKKNMPLWLGVVLVFVIGAVVAFIAWYIANYSKNNNDNVTNYDYFEIKNNVLTIKNYYNYMSNTELIKKVTQDLSDIKLNNATYEYKNDKLILSIFDEYSTNKFIFTGVKNNIKSIYYDEFEGAFDVFVLMNDGNLYYAGFMDDSTDDIHLKLINTNISAMKKNASGKLYFVDNSSKYYEYAYDYQLKKYYFKEVKLDSILEYRPCHNSIKFNKNSIKNNQIYYDDISVDKLVCVVDNDTDGIVIISNDKSIYYLNLRSEKLEKISNKKVENINTDLNSLQIELK